MKLQKYTKTSISILATIIVSYGLVSAWTNLTTVTNGDPLTSTVWNNMVTKVNETGNRVSGIFTDGSGNVGVGTQIPNSKLNVNGSITIDGGHIITKSPNGALVLNSGPVDGSDEAGIWFRKNNTLGNTTGYTNLMRITDTGNVGIGTTSPKAKFSVGFNNEDQLNFYSPGDNQLSIQTSLDGQAIGSYGGNAATLHLQPTAGMISMVTGGGNVGIGIASASQLLHVNGTALATAWNVTSDIRKKENIIPLENSLEKINNIRGVRFDWKKDGKKDVGVIAQEVEKEFPEFVTTDSEGFKSVDYGKLVSPLIESVKELKKENDKKDRQIEDLLNRVEKLENK